jgi:superfamily II DNA or RNA helicase
MDTSTIAGNVVAQYRKHALGKKAIYYGVSTEHSRHLATAFKAAGIGSRYLDGSSSAASRLDAAAALGDGRIAVLCNCEIFGEGFDLAALAPGATVEAVGLCRPTQSLTLHLQQIGRALRPKPEPAIILDHAGNLVRHGLPDEPREWSLDGISRKPRAADDDDQPIHICESCYAAYPSQLRVCPECGAERPAKVRVVEEINADLVEADLALIRAARLRQQRQATSLEDLRALAAARGYRPAWADHVYRARQARAHREAS